MNKRWIVKMNSLVSLSQKFGIPIVNIVKIKSSLDSILDQISVLKNSEGLVIRYDLDNEFSYLLKIKTEDYVKMHKMLSTVIIDKNLVELIFLEKIDDVLILKNNKLKSAITRYENDFTNAIENFATNILNFFNNAIEEISHVSDQKEKKKIFATQYVVHKKEWSIFLYQLWDKSEKNLFNCLEIIKNYYLKNVTNNKKFEEFRKIVGLKNFSEYYTADIEN
ncbi:MAG: hypothetical protein QXR30_03750 [Candidatus Woesearchaeota archaeon]